MTDKLRRIGLALQRLTFQSSAARTAVSSFALVILLGALLLILPISSRQRVWTHPVDAVFTSTSAVCVTGLIVQSTPHYWSLFGQIVILALIQAGGLGIMTMGAFTLIVVHKRLSMRLESVMSDAMEPPTGESVWGLVRFICMFTFFLEAVGAVVLYFSWRGAFPNALVCFYHSVFHSVSAFCNAGFSLNDSSLADFSASVPVNIVICGLIILGGIGFVVVQDLLKRLRWRLLVRRGKRPRLSTHTKLALTVTAILLLVGFVGVYVMESHATLRGAPIKERVLASLFQSVTARTAGFNTVNTGMGALAPATAFLLMALMYVGGSPGSAAGGIKTTTLGIMVASIVATLRGRSKAHLFHHTVPEETVHRVVSIILLSLVALGAGVFILLITEDAPFQEVLFDAFSAFGTVGLTQGLTGPGCACSVAGRLALVALMFIGRLGPLTLVLSVAQLKEPEVYELPEGHVMVG